MKNTSTTTTTTPQVIIVYVGHEGYLIGKVGISVVLVLRSVKYRCGGFLFSAIQTIRDDIYHVVFCSFAFYNIFFSGLW